MLTCAWHIRYAHYSSNQALCSVCGHFKSLVNTMGVEFKEVCGWRLKPAQHDTPNIRHGSSMPLVVAGLHLV